jgi:catechol 2,3-dioxygenase-like lactoylglutathione lyase family enzyme
MNNKIRYNSLIPEFSVSDILVSKKFYIDLGFEIVYERVEDKFCFLSLYDNQIMIEEVNNNWNVGELEYPFGRGINISMAVNDIDKFYNNIKNKGIKLYKDIAVSKYRVDDVYVCDKQFLIQDPDGYLLRFTN